MYEYISADPMEIKIFPSYNAEYQATMKDI